MDENELNIRIAELETKTALLEEKEKLLKVESAQLDARKLYFERATLDQIRSSLWKSLKTIGVMIGIPTVILGFVGFKISVREIIDNEVGDKVTQIEMRAAHIERTITDWNIDKLINDVIRAETAITTAKEAAKLASQAASSAADRIENKAKLTVTELLKKTILDVTGSVQICWEKPSDWPVDSAGNPQIPRYNSPRIKLHSQYKEEIGGFDYFVLGGVRGIIVPQSDFSQQSTLQQPCDDHPVSLKKSLKANPIGLLADQLDDIEAIEFSTTIIKDKDIEAIKKTYVQFWQDVDLRLLLSVNGNGDYFQIGQFEFEEDGYELLAPVFMSEKTKYGHTKFTASFKLLEIVGLEDILVRRD